MPGISGAAFLPGHGERLAGISTSDAMNLVAPRSPIKGLNIVPNWRIIQGFFLHTRDQCCHGISFAFHVTDTASSWERELESKLKSSRATA